MVCMRRTIAAHTGLAVFLAFFAAPFLHLHTAEAEDDHHDDLAGHAHGAIVHAHLPDGHAADHDDADLTRPEEHELSLSIFAVVVKERTMPDLPFLLAARVEAELPAASAEPFVLLCPPRGHDPPALETTQPRAPPA
jgi:hypothetical protein